MGQPIMDYGADSAACNGWIALAFMARNQEQNPVARGNRALQRPVDRVPGAVETMPMQVEHPVGLDPAGPEAPVPAAVERCLTKIFDPLWR